MKIKKAIEILKAHNNWRRGHIEEMCLTPKEIGEAIDTVVSHYEKSEKVDFLKSAKQPSEITHPYDLSKK